MTKYRTVVVDDEALCRDALIRCLNQDAEIDLVGSASSGDEALEVIRKVRPNLLFLDIQIPELNGFELLQALARVEDFSMPAVVFVTSYDKYALRAFDVHAMDYLLKPFDRDRLAESVARAKHQIASGATAQRARLGQFMRGFDSSKSITRFPVKTSGKIIFVELASIYYIEASGNYLRYHSTKGELLSREKISVAENQLRGTDLVRIHRSVIVNRKHVKELSPLPTGEYGISLVNGKELTVSRGFRDRLTSLLTTH